MFGIELKMGNGNQLKKLAFQTKLLTVTCIGRRVNEQNAFCNLILVGRFGGSGQMVDG